MISSHFEESVSSRVRFFRGFRPSLKPTVRQWKQAILLKEIHLPSIHFQVLLLSVSGRVTSRWSQNRCDLTTLLCLKRWSPDWCAFPPNQIHQNHPKNAGLHPSLSDQKNAWLDAISLEESTEAHQCQPLKCENFWWIGFQNWVTPPG